MTNALTTTKTPKEKRSARTSKGTCTCTRSHTCKGTRTSKKAHAATQSRFYIIVEKWNSEKQTYKFQNNKCSMLPVVNSQSRVFQNDSKYSKSELQGTSDSKQLTLTSQKRNLSHVQSTCSSKTPRTLTTIFEVGSRGEAYKV